MPQITLTRAQALEIRAYCKRKKQPWFVAKDQGAYVGASRGPIFYFAGCDPNKDEWWEKTRQLFGGDDFGDELPMAWLDTVTTDPAITAMMIKVNKTKVACEFVRLSKHVRYVPINYSDCGGRQPWNKEPFNE